MNFIHSNTLSQAGKAKALVVYKPNCIYMS